jgi:hypothetical protein
MNACLRKRVVRRPQVPHVLSVTGTWATEAQAMDPDQKEISR